MRFFVSIYFFLLFCAPLVAETRYFGYRGTVPGVQNDTISSMVMRSDARYLFYSTGGSSFKALDLLDMATTSNEAVATNGVVFGLGLVSDTRLAALTAKGLQYFNIQYPFDVAEETSRYSRDSSATTTVMSACLGPDQTAYFLEEGAGRNLHILRTVSGTTAGKVFSWTDLFGSRSPYLNPISLYCGRQSVFVTANRIDESGIESEFWVATVSKSSATAFDLYSAPGPLGSNPGNYYSRVDTILHPKKDQLEILFNKKSYSSVGSSNSKILTVTTGAVSVDIGSDAQFLSGFLDGATAYIGAFLQNDWINYKSDYFSNTYRFLFSSTELLSSNCNLDPNPCFEKSGLGLSTSQTPSGKSLWVSSEKDHYKFGTYGSSGLILLTKAPNLEFVVNPMDQMLSSNRALTFTLTSDSNLDLEMRVDEEADTRGTYLGLNKPGKVVTPSLGSLSLAANTPTTYQVSSSALGLTKDRKNSLMIFASSPDDGASRLVARTGFTFTFDPPPGGVLNFRTIWGDQSVGAVFNLPSGGDISTILLYLSYDPALLASLPSDAAGVAAATTSLETGVNGGRLTSPIQISAANWSGTYIIAPIQNGRTLYIRPAVIDKGGQFSTANPEALSAQPGRTRTLSDALGSPASCSLRSTKPLSGIGISFLGLLFIIGVSSLRKKNWAQHF